MKLTKNEKVIISVIAAIVLVVGISNWYNNNYCTYCAIPVKCSNGGCH